VTRRQRIQTVTGAMAISLIALACVSCCTGRGPARDYAGRTPLPDHIASQFARPKQTEFDVKETIKDRQDAFTVKHVTLSNLDCDLAPPDGKQKGHSITLEWYIPTKPVRAPMPTILVLPIFGGGYEVSRLFAPYFAKKGFAAFIVHRQNRYRRFDDLEKIDPVLRQMVLDHRKVLDWLETRLELDANRIGSFGVSMGGIKNALLTSLDPRIKASVLGLAGGDLPHILAYSKEPGVVERRGKLLTKYNITQAQLFERLKTVIECDPLNYAEYSDARRVLIIRALFDKCIPPHSTHSLRKEMGNPRMVTVAAGHYSAIVYVPYIRRRSLSFFRKKLLSR
jgi:hypothetical protein